MMNLKRGAVAAALFLIILISAFRVYRAYSFIKYNPTEKPNVLVVSVCSFRAQMLERFGGEGGPDAAPNLEKFFAESQFVFTNAFNGLGWTNISNWIVANIPFESYFTNNYDTLGNNITENLWRVPWRRSVRKLKYFVNDNDFEKDAGESLAFIKKYVIRGDRSRPFFTTLHFKYLHYPLIDRFNSEAQWDRFLSPEEKAKVVGYLAHPEDHYHKLSFLLMLANNPYHILAHPKYKNAKWAKDPESLRKIMGLMTNPELLAEWKASEGYDADLVIFKKIYRANVLYLDKMLGEVFELWGDKKLKDNTIIIFAADHGESQMERGELTHGLSLWDSALHVPVAIRFPGGGGQEVIKEQVDSHSLSLAFKDILEGARTPATFELAIKKRLPEVTIARNCMNDIRGLRYKNKYKYFVRLADDQRFLFDLENDPLELKNVAGQMPEEVARMESLYWQNLSTIENVETNACPVSLPK